MAWTFNPFTGNFDQKGSGGGDAAPFAGQVDAYADLPLDSTAALNSRWLVKNNSGTWPFSTYKQAGIYIRVSTVGASRDTDYQFVGTLPSVMNDNEFLIYDDTDATKNLKFNVGTNVPTASTVTLTAPSASGTLALTSDFAAPPSIGSTTPAAGSFTTLAANTSLTLGTSGILSGGTNLIEQVNGINAQTFNIYRTSSSSNDNYERGFLRWTGTSFFLGTEAAGSGTRRSLELNAGSINMLAGGQQVLLGEFNRILIFKQIQSTIDINGCLFVGGTNFLEQRNGSNPQTLRLYNTYTSSTNFERLNFRWASNEFILDAEAGSVGGTLRGIKIGSATSSLLGFYGVTPVDQPATVADPSGVTTDEDVEARTAINAIIDRLQELGLIA